MSDPVHDGQSPLTVETYLAQWLDRHGRANLRPSSVASYQSVIRNYIVPNLGPVSLEQLSAPMIDDLLAALLERGLAPGVVRLVRKTMGAALEQARKYRYIERNPTKDLLTRLPRDGDTPDPYTVSQMQQLLGRVAGTRWEMPIMLAGLYGLRISEVLGLRWDHVDLSGGSFRVCEQLPFHLAAGTTTLEQLAPVKSQERDLPITAAARPYFLRQKQLQNRRMELTALGGGVYYDNHLVVAAENGAPYRRERVSNDFGRLLRKLDMPHIRFHDLRHTAATNMHELTGDFYTVGNILGHSMGGTVRQLQIPTGLDATTARYVNVRLDRKRTVLEAYHRALFPAPARTRPVPLTVPKDTYLKESSRTGSGGRHSDELRHRRQCRVHRR